MDSEWTMLHKDYGLVRVSKSLIEKLLNYRQLEKDAPESGGVLIGKHLNSNGAVLLDDFTSPQKSDRQERCRYYRSSEHNQLVQQIWRDSDHQSTYVGLWHTHAEPRPNFSSVDKKDWNNALKKSRYEGSALFFFIIGQTHIRCWIGMKKNYGNKIEMLGEYNASLE